MIKPQRDQLKVKVKEDEDKVIGSFIIPKMEKTHKDLATAEVVAVGPGFVSIYGHLVKPDYEVGDVVMFKNHPNLDKILDKGVEYLLVPNAEICATVEDEPVS